MHGTAPPNAACTAAARTAAARRYLRHWFGERRSGVHAAIAVDGGDPEHLYAPDMQAGVVESSDGGRTWEPLGSPGMAMSVSTTP